MAKVIKGKGKPVATAEPEVKKEAKVEVEAKETNGKKNGNTGFKSVIIYSEKGLAINVPIKFRKLHCEDIDKEYPIIHRNAKGQEARYKSYAEGRVIETKEDKEEGWFQCDDTKKISADSTGKKYFTADGEMVSDEIFAFQLVDGKETSIEKFKKSEEFRIIALKNSSEYEDWMPEPYQGLYTIFAEKDIDQYSLYQFAKMLIDKDQFAVTKIALSSNGYKQYYGLIKARVINGGFALTMKISRQKLIDKLASMPIYNEKPKEVVVGKAKTGLADL